MLRHNSLILGAGLLTAGLAAAGHSDAAGSNHGLTCEVRVRPAGAGVDLTAIANSAVTASGKYRLVVIKRGPAGGTEIEQSGSFSIEAGGVSNLSSVSPTLESGATYDAELTITSQSIQITCRRVLPPML